MNRAQQVREVFLELRRALGDHVTAAEVLASAASLVELFAEEEDGPQFSLRQGGLPFEMQALDVAFADGGWRVLANEWRQMGFDDGDACGGRPDFRLL
jgi:hypothetical protein